MLDLVDALMRDAEHFRNVDQAKHDDWESDLLPRPLKDFSDPLGCFFSHDIRGELFERVGRTFEGQENTASEHPDSLLFEGKAETLGFSTSRALLGHEAYGCNPGLLQLD